MATEFCMVALNICGSSAWKVLQATLLTPIMLMWPLDLYKKNCKPLAQKAAVVTLYEVISWHLPEVTEKKKKHEQHQ